MSTRVHPPKQHGKLLTYFLEDVGRLPIITGRAEWLPLLRQIQRGVTLQSIRKESDQSTLDALRCVLHDELSAFNGYCRAVSKPSLNTSQLTKTIEQFFADPDFTPVWPSLDSARPQSSVTIEEDVRQEHEERGLHILYLLSLLPPDQRADYTRTDYNPINGNYFADIHNTFISSKQKLVEGTLRYVFSVARLYIGRGVSFPDLVQEGTFGLMRATEAYSELQGAHFQHYAAMWIRQTIMRAIAEQSRLIRIPVHLHDSAGKLQQEWDKIVDATGEAPNLYTFSLKQGWLSREDVDTLNHYSQFNELRRRIRPYIERYAIVRASIAKRRNLWRQHQQIGGGKLFVRGKESTQKRAHSSSATSNVALKRKNFSKEKSLERTTFSWSKRALRNAIHQWYGQTSTLGREPTFDEFCFKIGWLTPAEIYIYRHCTSLQYVDALQEAQRKLSDAKKEFRKLEIVSASHCPVELLKDNGTLSAWEDDSVIELPDGSFEAMQEFVDSKLFRESFADVCEDLAPRAQQILEARIGLYGDEPKTLEELAQPWGLTRERIRQLEAKALQKLQHPARMNKLGLGLYDSYEFSSAVWDRKRRQVVNKMALYAELEDILTEEKNQRQIEKIDYLLNKYIIRGRKRIVNTRSQYGRAELFRQVLKDAGEPLHYSIIHERVLAQIPEELGFSKKSTYATLFYHSAFQGYSQGVFGLAEWTPFIEDVAGTLILKHCPIPLLKQSGEPRTFFESILQGQSWLQTRAPLSARQFYLEMLALAGRDTENNQEAQMAFDAWYAAGLIERIDYVESPQKSLNLTLPEGMRLTEMRAYCLNMLCQRIDKLSELLLVIEQITHPKLTAIQKVLFGGEKAGYDVSARLTLLAAFDAVRKEGDEWQLAATGKAALAANPPQELPDFGELAAIEEADEAPTEIEWEEDLGLLMLDSI